MSGEEPVRPDPDALLAALGREDRGKLKIFLGAAPGVGKTFAMLSSARRLRLAHLDVVVGLVETHGRAETEALLDGLEILPRRLVPYRGRDLAEFDLDAALARKPALMIVDELAHSNPPDSRHPKRYQDVAELLDAGIDVWTALNIQHLEGLSDIVARLTGVTVRETVPDTVLDAADDVVVVDITPAELITRLSEGRIYLPETAARAANSFFKPGNLTALRELALRRTADRVDDQMVDHLRHHSIEGAWPTAERILVCVGPDAASEPVVRAASRLASGLNAPWIAVTLERSGLEITDEAALRRIDAALQLAERLGAETMRLSGLDLPAEILRVARRENITQIVVGRSAASAWARWRGRSLSDALLRRASNVAIHVVAADAPAVADAPKPDLRGRQFGFGTAVVCGSVAGAVLVGIGLNQMIRLPNLSMIFLAAVLACAITIGQWAAIAAAILSFLAYNFFFIAPVYTFTIAEPHEVFALLVFLLVAVITGGLAGRVRDQSAAASNRVATIQALYDVSRKLAGTAGLDDVLWVVVRQAAAAVRGQAVILLGRDAAGREAPLAISAAFPPEDDLQPGEWAAARWAFERGEQAGWRTGTLPNANYRFVPIRTSRGLVGVVGLAPKDRSQSLPDNDRRTVVALIDQGALAIERALLVAEARAGEALAERERLQTVLLSSLSHDLRTPLASILGAVTSLQSFGDRMPATDRRDLLGAIQDNAVRLTRFVSNLLDMTRVESGGVALRREPIDLEDLFASLATRARQAFPDRALRIEVGPELPLVLGDPVLFEQVLFNILDNADKYAAPATPTRLKAGQDGRSVVITIEDQGPGIPAGDLDRVFEKFMRLQVGDGRPAGTGLGLAIAKGVVEAMGGSIRAESPIEGGRGTRFIIRLPAAGPAAMVPAETEDAV